MFYLNTINYSRKTNFNSGMICISGHPRVWCCFTWHCGEWGKERMAAGLSGGSFCLRDRAQLGGSLWALPWAPQIKHKLPPAAQVSCALPLSCCTCSSGREEAAAESITDLKQQFLSGERVTKDFYLSFCLGIAACYWDIFNVYTWQVNWMRMQNENDNIWRIA